MDSTKVFNTEEFNEALIKDMLKDVIDSLEERGYEPIEQIVGYLISGDPGYISSHREARNKIIKYDRSNILEVLLKNYVK